MTLTPPNELTVVSSQSSEVQTVLHQARMSMNPLVATDYGNQLLKKTGVQLAELVYGLRRDWPLYRAAGIEDDFGDFIDAHMLISGKTAEKYARMYEVIFENAQIPAETKEHLSNKPIEHLLLLTAAVDEGSFDTDDLEEIALLDKSEIREKVREARGLATSAKTAVFGRLVRREHSKYPRGTIVAFGYTEDGEPVSEPIGYLNLEPETQAGQKMLARFINRLNLEDIR